MVFGALVVTEIPQAYVPPAAERELYINLLLSRVRQPNRPWMPPLTTAG
jgi:hypothetical protein